MNSIKQSFTGACERAGIEDLRPYDLRHTFATRLLERGVHAFIISALLGHSTRASGLGLGSRITPGYAYAYLGRHAGRHRRPRRAGPVRTKCDHGKSWQMRPQTGEQRER